MTTSNSFLGGYEHVTTACDFSWPLVKTRQLTTVHVDGTYELSFDITPQGVVSGYTNILHVGEANDDRLPSIFFKPSST